MIQGITGIGAAALRATAGVPQGGIAATVAGALGDRVAAWVAQLSGGSAGGTGFRPDTSLLARGGDIYGIGDIARDVAVQVGASAAEEGALQRAIEDFTREAVIATANGADSGGRPASIDRALDAAQFEGTGIETADGVIGRLEQATASLRG